MSHKGLYTMGRSTKRPNTTKGQIKPKQKHYKNYKRVPILQSEANPRSLWRSWAWFHCLLWNLYDYPKPHLHHCLRVGENFTSNFSDLSPTTKHTNISAESGQTQSSLKTESKCYQKIILESWKRPISYYQGAWRLSSRIKDKHA